MGYLDPVGNKVVRSKTVNGVKFTVEFVGNRVFGVYKDGMIDRWFRKESDALQFIEAL